MRIVSIKAYSPILKHSFWGVIFLDENKPRKENIKWEQMISR
jgi:hypothetical protein|nr:MAG TPA: hypothetical protein [Caudoviricetes sp.]